MTGIFKGSERDVDYAKIIRLRFIKDACVSDMRYSGGSSTEVAVEKCPKHDNCYRGLWGWEEVWHVDRSYFFSNRQPVDLASYDYSPSLTVSSGTYFSPTPPTITPGTWRVAYDTDYKTIKLTNNMTISSMMRRILDKDIQTLVKARFINGDLELTNEGTKALLTILFTANKTELVKLAEELLAEEKESK